MLRVHGIHSDQFSPVETQDTEQTKKLQRLIYGNFISVIQSKIEVLKKHAMGGIRIKNVIVFPIEALPCQCAFKKFETHIFLCL